MAVGFERLDHDQPGTTLAPRQPERGRHRCGERAHPRLHEDVRGWRITQFGDDLARHHAIPMHHIDRNVAIPLVGRIADDGPAVRLGLAVGMAHRVVIVARHTHHLGAVVGDGRTPAFADRGVDVDHASAAEHLRAPGHRASMVAVGGAGHGDLPRKLAPTPGKHVGHRHRLAAVVRQDGLLQQAVDRVGSAERLEALEREPRALVLVQHLGHAELPRQRRQPAQGRGAVSGPLPDLALGGVEPGLREDLRACAPVRLGRGGGSRVAAGPQAGVDQQFHGHSVSCLLVWRSRRPPPARGNAWPRNRSPAAARYSCTPQVARRPRMTAVRPAALHRWSSSCAVLASPARPSPR